MTRRGFAILVLAFAACKKPAPGPPSATLSFVKEKTELRSFATQELVDKVPVETVSGYDPYYKKVKRFRAVSLKKVLEAGFAGEGPLEGKEFVFRASDGYAVYVRGALAVEDGGYIALEDLDVAGWEPVGPQQASPAPFYVFWSKPEQVDLESHPRPWQLVKIEMLRFEAAYPFTKPGDLPATDPAMVGYGLFRDRCFKCHAINREGGRVGPDLNVPKNVLEYRPEEQVRAYIKNPLDFRYSAMPPHPDFTDKDLDGLIAYLRAMKEHKHDAKE